MKALERFRGFSLIEVILAAAIFAGSVTVIIGLLAVLARQAGETSDSLAARQLPDATKIELDRLAIGGMDSLAGQIPTMTAPLGDGLELTAPRDVAEVQSLNYRAPAAGRIPADEQYYLVECWRFPAEPLRYDPTRAFLALHVRISWPYRLPGLAMPVAKGDRNQLTFVVSINR
jgi:hypothetical protein